MSELSKPGVGVGVGGNGVPCCPPAAAAGADEPPPVRRYAVLYYKRSKKVHKSRGVSRLDGVLTVAAPPSCLVTLADADGGGGDDDASSSDDDADARYGGKKKGTKKAGGKKNKKKLSKPAHVSSGINWSVAKRAFSLEESDDGTAVKVAGSTSNEFRLGPNGLSEGDIVELPQWECEVTGVLTLFSSSSSSGGGAGSAVTGVRQVSLGGGNKSSTKPNTTLMRRPAQPLVSRKRPLVSLKSGSGPGRRGIGGSAASSTAAAPAAPAAAVRVQKPLLPKRVPPKQPGPSVGSNGGSGILARRKPPAQPQAMFRPVGSDSEGDGDGDGDDENAAVKSNVVAPKPLRRPAPLLGGKKRMVVCGPRGAASATGPTPAQPSNSDVFPGAIGTIVAPASIRGKLRPHQREGVTFLWNCLTGSSPSLNRVAEESGAGPSAARGAILGDEMGLGKTLMTITTIFALHRRDRDMRFVVVCPSSLVTNWSKEFDKWIGRASQPKRVVIRKGGEDGQRAIRAFVPVKPNKSEVLIVSYELFRMNVGVLSQAAQIGLLVVDEGHRLKNTAGSQTLSALNSLRCDARLLITGTPIQNNLSEFYNVVNFVCPGILSDLNTFRRTYERPITAANTRSATAEQRSTGRSLSRTLDGVTSTFMLRRLQRDVLRDHLPPRTEILLFCRPSERQRNEYKRLTAGVSGRISPVGGSADSLTLLTKVRKLCSHPYLLNESAVDDPLPPGNEAGHTVQDSGNDEDVSLSGKLSVLDSLLSAIRVEAPAEKCIVISNFTSALSVIERTVLRRRGWSSIRLDGTTEQSARQSLVDSFNRGTVEQSFVFLLSSKAGGCGLNLIGANRLIMFDPDWNPATDMQAMARVYRQGQTRPCFIYRMFTSGTVEEVIYQRQTQKSNLATLTVDGQGKSKKSGGTKTQASGFTKEELRDCFTLKEDCLCDTKQKVGKKWDDYSGANSLQSQGCTDGPLLSIADDRQDVLSFVRIVPDEPSGASAKKGVESDDDESSNEMDKAAFDSDGSFTDEEEFEG